MRIVFIGNVESSRKALEKLIKLKADVVGVLTKKESSFNADFMDLAPLCRRHKIPFRYVDDINEEDNLKWMAALRPDVALCFGFSQLIKNEFLKIPRMGVIGYHPAKLPQNRGRHPLVWALALGLKETASTFFFMDEGADSGDILSQVKVAITYQDNARTLYDKVTRTALKQIEEFLPALERGNLKRIKQDPSKSGYWRKRGQEDGKVDFRTDSRTIYNLVRALTKPYVGAHVTYQNKDIKVWRVREVKSRDQNVGPGQVLKAGKQVLVKCGEGAVLLAEHEFQKKPKVGEYLG